MPLFTEYHTGATRFANLSSTERKDFLNAQHIYKAQLKEYTQQAQKLLDVQNKIQLSVSDTKKAQLPIEKTTKKWLQILTDGTKPTSAMAIQTAG
jgi:putative sterol carrier protein